MSGRRFIIHSRIIRNGYASFDGDLFNHMVRVLRLGPGDAVVLVDEQEREYKAVVNQVAKEWVVAKIVSSVERQDSEGGGPKITICQALPKGEKIDLILQKGTELGVHSFWLFGGRRSVARVRDDQLENKLERWRRITAEAARQCSRRTVPTVTWYPSSVEAAKATTQELRLLLWEGERDRTLKNTVADMAPPASAIIAVGPEGGFDPLEVRYFSQHGYKPVSLGSRILRTETVAIAITSILQYIWGDM